MADIQADLIKFLNDGLHTISYQCELILAIKMSNINIFMTDILFHAISMSKDLQINKRTN